ncbi:MAG TPA: hypothetical protein VI911_11365 [Patescibacteria group bacterium]|nr:hypothetical protein [Patescibacteria group bacterium]
MKQLQKMVNELQESNSVNYKKEILAKYPNNKEYLRLIYSPFKQFGVTSKNVIKLNRQLQDVEPVFSNDLIHLLTMLSDREITGHIAIASVQKFIDHNLEFEDLILSAIDKNLKCRIEADVINAVFPNCVPTFNVVLAKDYNKITKKPNFDKESWYCSRKLDGCRLLVVKMGEDVKCFSRTGKEFETLDVIKEEVSQLNIDNCVLDGEMCLVDENGQEDFQSVMSEIRRKDHTIKNPAYKIFDMLTIGEFVEEKGNTNLTERLNNLNKLMENYKGTCLQVLKQSFVPNLETLMEGVSAATKQGWEGLIIRHDVPYEGKRTNNLLKLKKFFDDEYVVTDIEIGKMRFALGNSEIEEEVMTKAVIKHKGFDVGVGSGWSIAQRRQFKNNPSDILGKTVTIQYFEETQNQDGGISLRFPTFKAIHGDKREI